MSLHLYSFVCSVLQASVADAHEKNQPECVVGFFPPLFYHGNKLVEARALM